MLGKKQQKNQTEQPDSHTRAPAKKIKGVVVSDKMDKTVTVLTSRFVRHTKYGKYVKVNKKYKVHDPENTYKVGDEVEIEEARKLSKTKSFRIANH